MPYQSNRAVVGVSGHSRVKTAALISALAVLMAVVIFVAVNPRDFTQIFLTDSAYARNIIGHNARTLRKAAEPTLQYLDAGKQYETDGKLGLNLSAGLSKQMGDDLLADQVEKYVSTFTFQTESRMQQGNLCGELHLNDADGPVMDTQMVAGNGRLDVNRNQLPLGWQRTETSQANSGWNQVLDSRTKRLLRSSDVQDEVQKCVKKGFRNMRSDFSVSVENNCDFLLADRYASGDRLNIVMAPQDLSSLVQNSFWYMKDDAKLLKVCNEVLGTGETFRDQETFGSYIYDLGSRILGQISSSGFKGASLDLCVDRHRNITAANILIKRDGGDIAINAILKDAKDRGPALKVRRDGSQLIYVDARKRTARDGKADITFGTSERTTFHWSNFGMDNGLPFGRFRLDPVLLNSLKAFGPVGFDMTFRAAEKGNGVRQDGTVSLGNIGTFTVGADIKSVTPVEMRIPNDVEITTASEEVVQQAWNNYLFTELPKTHPQWRSIVLKLNNILQEYAIAQTYGNSY